MSILAPTISPVWSVVLALALMIVGCVTLLFVWHPIQRFLLLRDEMAARMVLFKKERARYTINDTAEPSQSQSTYLREKLLLAWQHEFNEFACRMKSFAATQRMATWTLQRLNFDPLRIEAGLRDLSDLLAAERRELHLQTSDLGRQKRA